MFSTWIIFTNCVASIQSKDARVLVALLDWMFGDCLKFLQVLSVMFGKNASRESNNPLNNQPLSGRRDTRPNIEHQNGGTVRSPLLHGNLTGSKEATSNSIWSVSKFPGGILSACAYSKWALCPDDRSHKLNVAMMPSYFEVRYGIIFTPFLGFAYAYACAVSSHRHIHFWAV